jgi:two-component system, LuxR family, sensor kinase FixL
MSEIPAIVADLDLAEDPALLRSLLGISDLLVVVLDAEGRIKLFNRACEKLTGFSASEVIDRPIWTTLIPESERPGVMDIAARLKAGETDNQFTNHWLTRDNGKRLIHWRNTALVDDDGRERHIVGTGIDITELDRASKALAAHQRQLRTLFDALPALVAEIDSEYCVRFANHGYREWFGLDPEAQIGRPLAEVIGEPAFSKLQPCFARTLDGEITVYHGEVPYSRGGTRLIHGTYVPNRNNGEPVDGFYILAVDLTEQHRLRERLEEETRRSRTIIDHSIDGVVTIDETGMIQSFNPAAERLFGFRADEVLDRNVAILMPEGEGRRHDNFINAHVKKGQATIIGSGHCCPINFRPA